MKLTCPECGKVRNFRPATIAILKTHVCRECIDRASLAKWVTITCKQCGRERKVAPAEAKRRHKTGSCFHCPRHAPAELPDTFDAGYVLGAVLGDGSLAVLSQKTGKTYVVRLSVTDRAFAERFRGHLAACTGKKPWMTTHTASRKANPEIGMPETRVTEWIVGLTNRDWYDRLKPFEVDRKLDGLTDRPESFRRGLLQGLIDAEGYIPAGREYLDITNKDTALLDMATKVFESLGQTAKVYGPYHYSRGVAHLRVKPGDWVKTVEVA